MSRCTGRSVGAKLGAVEYNVSFASGIQFNSAGDALSRLKSFEIDFIASGTI